jgi:hypothetical protein
MLSCSYVTIIIGKNEPPENAKSSLFSFSCFKKHALVGKAKNILNEEVSQEFYK